MGALPRWRAELLVTQSHPGQDIGNQKPQSLDRSSITMLKKSLQQFEKYIMNSKPLSIFQGLLSNIFKDMEEARTIWCSFFDGAPSHKVKFATAWRYLKKQLPTNTNENNQFWEEE